VPELREVHLGELDGGAFRIAVRRRDPIVAQVFREQRWDAIPGAETMEAFAARTRAGLARMVEGLQPGTTIAAVVHGGVIGELCRQASDSRPFAFVHADNGSLSRLVLLPEGHWWVRSFNEGAHVRQAALSPEHVT
jgi:probable phosphoglycerate mutase